jgi:hypothetical protein
MRKLKALKIRGVQREEKMKKMCFVGCKAFFFSPLVIYSLLLFICTSQMISRAGGSASITF